jgi:ribosome-binding factor A
MESKRQEKIARLIQKEMGMLFQKELSTFGHGGMLTITKAKVSPDLTHAKVYVSILAVDDPSLVVEELNDNEKTIRFEFGKKVKNQIRHVPRINFFEDDSMDYYENIDRLLKED